MMAQVHEGDTHTVKMTIAFSDNSAFKAMFAEAQLILASDEFSEQELALFKNNLVELLDSNRLFKMLVIPAGAANKLVIDLAPSDEYLSVVAALRASQNQGIGVGHG